MFKKRGLLYLFKLLNSLHSEYSIFYVYNKFKGGILFLHATDHNFNMFFYF